MSPALVGDFFVSLIWLCAFDGLSGHGLGYRCRPLPVAPHPAAENSPDGSDSSAAFSGEDRQAKRGLTGSDTQDHAQRGL